MSAVDNSRGGGTGGGRGGGGKDNDDDFSPGKGGNGSGGGDDRKKDDNTNRKDTNNWGRRASGGDESVAGASNNSASANSSHGQTTQSPDQSEQFRQDMEQATRDSIQHTVGAYSVIPGSVPSRREVGENCSNISPVINTTDGNAGTGGPNNNNGGGSADVLAVLRAMSESGNGDASALLRAISESGNASGGQINTNLPLNIDFIAEATLVPHEQQQQRNDVENDVDTIGLPPHAAPEEGGAIDNDGVSYISAITNPTTMDDVTVSRIRETPTIPSAIVPPTSNNIVTDEEAQIRSTVANSTAICENNNVLQASSTVVSNQDTQHLGAVYEAEIVEDGPMHVLRSKYGKVMCGISIAIILVLSLGLAFGLTYGRSKSTGEPPVDDPNQVLNYAGGNFCNSGGAPYLFDYEHEPFCSKEDVMLGGTIQQAVVIAQRRPHPYCPEGEEVTETTESLCSVSKSTPQISLVNGGAIRGEITADTPITREMVRDILPFTSDTIAYVELLGSDVVQVLENALAYVTRETPLNPYLQSGYPYASGLKFDVDLTSDTKVSNVRVLNSETGEYAPIDLSTSYWMVTNRYISENGDGYLTDVTPLQVAPTKLGYTYELEQYLIGLSPEYWVPPTLDEMSTTSFNATGVSVASVDDVPIEYFESEPGQ